MYERTAKTSSVHPAATIMNNRRLLGFNSAQTREDPTAFLVVSPKTRYVSGRIALRNSTQTQYVSSIARLASGWRRGVNVVKMWGETLDRQDWRLGVDNLQVTFRKRDSQREDVGAFPISVRGKYEDSRWRDIDSAELGVRLSAHSLYVLDRPSQNT